MLFKKKFFSFFFLKNGVQSSFQSILHTLEWWSYISYRENPITITKGNILARGTLGGNVSPGIFSFRFFSPSVLGYAGLSEIIWIKPRVLRVRLYYSEWHICNVVNLSFSSLINNREHLLWFPALSVIWAFLKSFDVIG